MKILINITNETGRETDIVRVLTLKKRNTLGHQELGPHGGCCESQVTPKTSQVGIADCTTWYTASCEGIHYGIPHICIIKTWVWYQPKSRISTFPHSQVPKALCALMVPR